MGNSKKAVIVVVFAFYCIAQVLSLALFPAKTAQAKAETKTNYEAKKQELTSIALYGEPHFETASLIGSDYESATYVAPTYAVASFAYIPQNEIEKMIIDMGGNAHMIKIMKCESNGNPRAKNPRSSASGLFQFLDSTWRGMGGSTQRAMDASIEEQIRLAIKLYKMYGPRQWECK